MQRTLKGKVRFDGVGLHSGRPVRMTVGPAPADFGIRFERTDLADAAPIPARWDRVVSSSLCTRIANEDGASVATIEHVMAALAGCGIQNALVAIDGPEVPVLDGSALPFVAALLECGTQTLAAPVRCIEVLEPVSVTHNAARVSLSPAEGFEIAFSIDFDEPAIGRQTKTLDMANGAFVHELANCRTFCRASDVERMRANGLALGGSLANAVVFDGDVVLTPGGLRYRDEPVRHKMLDALGDLALAGAPLIARYEGDRAGHRLTAQLLAELFTRPSAWRMVACDAAADARLPGAGVSRADLMASA